MKSENSLKVVEPIDAVKRHPVAALVGAAVTAIFCGTMGALGASPIVGFTMAVFGALIGAPGAAHIAESAAHDQLA